MGQILCYVCKLYQKTTEKKLYRNIYFLNYHLYVCNGVNREPNQKEIMVFVLYPKTIY